MRNTRKNSKKLKENEAPEPLPVSNVNSPGPSSGLPPPLESWHNGQKKKFKGSLSAAKSLFQSDDEESQNVIDKEKPSEIEIVEPVMNKGNPSENKKAHAGTAPSKKKLPVSEKWHVKNFMEVDSPQIEQQSLDLEEYSGVIDGQKGDRNIVYMRKGTKRSRVFVFDPESSDEFFKVGGSSLLLRSSLVDYVSFSSSLSFFHNADSDQFVSSSIVELYPIFITVSNRFMNI